MKFFSTHKKCSWEVNYSHYIDDLKHIKLHLSVWSFRLINKLHLNCVSRTIANNSWAMDQYEKFHESESTEPLITHFERLHFSTVISKHDNRYSFLALQNSVPPFGSFNRFFDISLSRISILFGGEKLESHANHFLLANRHYISHLLLFLAVSVRQSYHLWSLVFVQNYSSQIKVHYLANFN